MIMTTLSMHELDRADRLVWPDAIADVDPGACADAIFT